MTRPNDPYIDPNNPYDLTFCVMQGLALAILVAFLLLGLP